MNAHLKSLIAALGLLGVGLVAQSCQPTWQPHPNDTSWPLRGKHVNVGCGQCHADGFDVALPTVCEGCHEPIRPAGHDPGPCGECHTEEGWDKAGSDHLFFPLTNAHALACESCHTNGTYEGLNPACASCHEADRPADHHVGEDCGGCHTPTTWGNATVDHSFFPLTNAHDVACESCHTNGTYEGLNRACGSCHEAERPANHFVGNDCAECHTPTEWGFGEFDHDPYYDVPHEGVSQCASCHLQAPDYRTFSCIDCHEHRRSEVDGEHEDEPDYVYASDACLRCHN